MKLIKDFGIRAWFGTLLIAPVGFAIVWAVVHPESVVAIKELSAVIGAWIMAILVFYFNKPTAP